MAPVLMAPVLMAPGPEGSGRQWPGLLAADKSAASSEPATRYHHLQFKACMGSVHIILRSPFRSTTPLLSTSVWVGIGLTGFYSHESTSGWVEHIRQA